MGFERIDDATVLVVGTSAVDGGGRGEDGRTIDRTLESTGADVRWVDRDEVLEELEASEATISCVVVAPSPAGRSDSDGDRGERNREPERSHEPASEHEHERDLELIRTIDERAPAVPIVYAPAAGDERLASEAIRRGIADYLPRPVDSDRLLESVTDAIDDGRERRRERSRARGFDAIFDDPRTDTWVLETDGSVVRANRAAREALETDVYGSEGESESEDDRQLEADVRTEPAPENEGECRSRDFWDLPWWPDDTRETVRAAVDRAAAGTVDERELECGGRTLEVTVRPITDETGTVVSLVADAIDVTEHVRLERELRESEELHRVTLNNMTDTVLITDDDGAFTYVCPNVHFIFGYTDEEIHEMGTIDDLLGADLYDRDELETAGVLTNLECTATDRTGREHTLLVNVRRVSIQGGTVLYSCRDVTERKAREEALAALQRTARKLLYAETKREIGDIVVEDAPSVLGVEASGAFVFDTTENVLRPVAISPELERLHGPLPPFRASEESITGACFVDGETRFFDDVHESERLANRATDVRSGAFVPLGDHGVFVAGSADAGTFDEVTRELADLLAATAEAALDRVERETTLREQERELQRQNDQLTRLDRINEIIRDIDRALVRAETREEIERAVCDRLTADDRFRFAWIGEPDPAGNALEARDWSGHDHGYLDSVAFDLEGGDDSTETGGDGERTSEREHDGSAGEEGERTGIERATSEPASRTAASGSITVVSNVVEGLREEAWRQEALSRDFQSIVSVPLAYDEFAYGVLTVYADHPSAFDDVSRAVFEELGETIASAMGAVDRKSALLTTSSTRLEFEIRDPSFVFYGLAARGDCTVSLSGGIHQDAEGTSVFAAVDGARIDEVAAIAKDLSSVDEVQVITGGEDDDGRRDPDALLDDGETETDVEDGDDDGGTLRLHLSTPFLALRLADHGIVLHRVEATPTAARVVVDVPSGVDPNRSVEIVDGAFTDVSLTSKGTVDQRSARDLRSAFLEQLTDRQLEVVQVAYYGGFFESPRESTGEDVADTLGISPAAFYNHNRTVQRKLFAALFDDVGLQPSPGTGVE